MGFREKRKEPPLIRAGAFWIAAALLCAAFAGSARAGDDGDELSAAGSPLPADPEVEIRISKAVEFTKRGELSRAIDLYQSAIEHPQQCVVPLRKGLFVNHRELCHQRIAALGPEGLHLYRLKYDPPARRLFEAAGAKGDPRPLKEVWVRFRCTSFGEEALEKAGDLHHDRGEARQALACWERLLRWQDENGTAGSQAVYGKASVLLKWLGENRAASAMVKKALVAFPDGGFTLAGNRVAFADLESASFFRNAPGPSKTETAAVPSPLGSGLGDAVPGRLDLCWIWKHRNARATSNSKPSSRNRETTLEASPSMPAVNAGRCFFRDGEKMISVDLRSGKLKWESKELPSPVRATGGPTRWMQVGMGSMTPFGPSSVTAKDDDVYAVEGDLSLTSNARVRNFGRGRMLIRFGGAGGRTGTRGNRLCAWRAGSGKRVWTLGLPEKEEKGEGEETDDEAFIAKARFLWSPTVFRDRLYVPAQAGDEVYICAIDRASGRLLWRTCVFTGFGNNFNMFNRGQAVSHGELSRVAVGDGVAVLLSNRGHVAAVEAGTGYLMWIAEYPSEALNRRGNPRNMNSSASGGVPSHPLVTDGRILVAPSDSKYILCFRAANGALQWRSETGAPGTGHIIGLTGGLVVVGGKAVSANDVRSGKKIWSSIDFKTNPDGTGVLSGRFVFFPVEGFLYVIDTDGGKLVNRFGVVKSEFGHATIKGDKIVLSYSKHVVCYRIIPVGEKNEGGEGGREERRGEGGRGRGGVGATLRGRPGNV